MGQVYGYRSVSSSLISLFQLVLGIFDYDELWAANRVLAPLLFGSFAVLVILILMNIFLAIVNDAFISACLCGLKPPSSRRRAAEGPAFESRSSAVVSERQKQAQSLTGIFRCIAKEASNPRLFRRR